MGQDKQKKTIVQQIGHKLKEVTGPPPEDLPERMKKLLEQMKRK